MNKYNVNRSAESQHFFEENVQYRINVKKWVVGQIANSVPSTYPKSYFFYNNISRAGYCYFNTMCYSIPNEQKTLVHYLNHWRNNETSYVQYSNLLGTEFIDTSWYQTYFIDHILTKQKILRPQYMEEKLTKAKTSKSSGTD